MCDILIHIVHGHTLLVGLRIRWLYPLRRSKITPKRGVLSMTLNDIRWWGSSSAYMESVDYPFIAMTTYSILTQNGNTC